MLSSIDTSLCNKLVSDYNSIAAPIYAAKAMVRQKMFEVETKLREMVWSTDIAIIDAIDKFQDNIAAALPKADMAAMNDLKRFMDQCVYLSDISPMSIIIGTATGVSDYMNTLIGKALPEFGASGLFSDINDSFGSGGGVTNSFNQVDALLNCLSLVCGPGYAGAVGDITADLNNLYITLNVIDSGASRGNFNTEKVYGNAGLNSDQITNINNVTASIDGAKSDSAAAIEASASKVQELTKAGDFF